MYATEFEDADGSWALVTGPTDEPITLDDCKQQARITQPNGDASLLAYRRAAREEAEEVLGRGLLTQTWQLSIQCFADLIWLPRAAPLQSVTSVQYYDSAGVLTTLPTTYYTVDTVARPGRIVRKANQAWPTPESGRLTGRIVITYVIGWTSVELIPERIKQGIRMWVTYLDRNRDGFSPDGDKARDAARACWDDRVRWLPPASVA